MSKISAQADDKSVSPMIPLKLDSMISTGWVWVLCPLGRKKSGLYDPHRLRKIFEGRSLIHQ